MAKKKKKKNRNRNGSALALGGTTAALAGVASEIIGNALGQLVADGVERYAAKDKGKGKGKKKLKTLRKALRNATSQKRS
jgi:hypothetical protein